MGYGGTHELDVVPRGPRRWHRLATSHVEHPDWEGSQLYAERLGQALDRLLERPLPYAVGYRHTEPLYGWPAEKPVRFYTCTPLCAAMAETTRRTESITPIDEWPKRSRCEVCGRTLHGQPFFNVDAPTQADADAYRQWFKERVEQKQESDKYWASPEGRRKIEERYPELATLTGVVQPPFRKMLYIDSLGNTVSDVFVLVIDNEREFELFAAAENDVRAAYARKHGTNVLH